MGHIIILKKKLAVVTCVKQRDIIGPRRNIYIQVFILQKKTLEIFSPPSSFLKLGLDLLLFLHF